MSIVVDALSKVYGAQKALDGISFSAKPGRIGLFGARMAQANQPL